MRCITHISLKFTFILNKIFLPVYYHKLATEMLIKRLQKTLLSRSLPRWSSFLFSIFFVVPKCRLILCLFTRCDMSDSKHHLSYGKSCHETLSYFMSCIMQGG